MSDYEEIKERADLNEYAAQHLTPGREKGSYICPFCDSGTGKNKTAGFKITPDGMKWHCFACNRTGDVYDLAGHLNGTDDRAEQLRIVAEWTGTPIEWRREAQAAAPTPKQTEKKKKQVDYSQGREKSRQYVRECAKRLKDMPAFDETRIAVLNYLAERGITEDEAISLGIGYDQEPKYGWKDEAGKWHNTPRIVLPWAGNDYYHIDRAIDNRADDLKYVKPKAEEVGKQPIYNPSAFDHDYIVVVEGVLDAIACQICGCNVVALAGTSLNDFATEAAARGYKGVVIEMLDADGHSDDSDPSLRKGRGAGADLVSLLDEAGITTLARAEYGIGESDTYGGHKDAGEWFAADRDDLYDMLEVMKGIAEDKAKRVKEADYREAMKHLNVKDPARVAFDVLEMRDIYEPVPTGIKSLDEVLGGGVSLGETTFFGAVSSYGKTTLAVQIADHIAANGYPVLFVTVEQSAKEIVAKSLSRLVYTENATGWNIATPQEITSLKTRKAWVEGQRDTLFKAVEDYKRLIAPNMRILEGNKQPTVSDIRAVAQMMMEHEGRAPIVFIDYLQLLAPLSERYDTDKRNADMNVTELRRMARDLKTHVWCISSLNRSSYSGVISLDSFKESGGIEYGADNLIGLQPHQMAEKLEGVADSKMKRAADKIVRDNKSKTERDCELVILKQRNGALPDEPLPLVFTPMSAYFKEHPSVERQRRRAV